MPDLSHRACPDHPCDRCAICRSGRCCQRDSPAPSSFVVGRTADSIFQAMRRNAERIRGELDGDRSVGAEHQQSDDRREHHTIVWVANEPSPKQVSSPPTADEAIRERERRTRERWRAEDRQQPAEVHHHYHQTVIRDAPEARRAATASDEEILDAEVVDETFTEEGSTDRPAAGEPLALPPATPDVLFPNPAAEEVRRRGRR